MKSSSLREMSPEAAAAAAVAAVGCGYDLCSDFWLSSRKYGPEGGRLIELDETLTHDLVFPGGIVVRDAPNPINCDKGERIRFRSDIVSFHQMSEQFNQAQSLSGKIPSGVFNSSFDFSGCWQNDASATKSLAYDGWYITLYNVELVSSHIILRDQVKEDVPSSWDPAALAEFIEKYGTHIIVGVKMGGKDIVHIKQQNNSQLQQTDVQNLLKKIAVERFSDNILEDFIREDVELSRKIKDKAVSESNPPFLKHLRSSSIVTHLKKDDIVSIVVRKGGIDYDQSHSKWLSTIPQCPTVISMSFVPLTSLLNGVRGNGFLSHAINLYLRYKPPIEELHYFLEFQLPPLWAPAFGDLPLGRQLKKQSLQSLQLTFLGPRLYVGRTQVDSGNRPVTGIRLHLEGKRNNCLAIHLQHLSALPSIFQLSDTNAYYANAISPTQKTSFEPIKCTLLSHVCTSPVQYNGTHINDSAYIVTRAWLEVQEIGMRKVLFLRLGFSNVSNMKIRRSEWDGSSRASLKSGLISALISSRFSTDMIPEAKQKVEVDSAIYPKGPPAPIRVHKMSKLVDTSEMTRGPNNLPGYWIVTGAKLCADGGRISLKVKYSLLIGMSEDDF